MTFAETEPLLRADPAGRPGDPARPGTATAVARMLACLVALGAVLTSSPLSAQQWPTRSIRIVTGTPAGGSPDFVIAKSLPYDPIKDFTFITLVSGYPMVVATAPNSPIKSFPDLIARAKAAPFDVTYGMNLPGSVHHLTGELINVEAGTSLRGIPYRGNTQIVQDLWAAGST
jgi:tripartite-type tricarboxylate transporter receptor subunit TctC